MVKKEYRGEYRKAIKNLRGDIYDKDDVLTFIKAKKNKINRKGAKLLYQHLKRKDLDKIYREAVITYPGEIFYYHLVKSNTVLEKLLCRKLFISVMFGQFFKSKFSKLESTIESTINKFDNF